MTDIMSILSYMVDLCRPMRRTAIPTLFITNGRRAHRIDIQVQRNGEPVDLTGCKVSGTARRVKSNVTIPISGSASGSVATLILPEAVYRQPGEVELFAMLEEDEVCNGIWAATACVLPSQSDRWVDGGETEYSLRAMTQRIQTLEKMLRQLSEQGAGQIPDVAQLVEEKPLDEWRFHLVNAISDAAYISVAEAAMAFDDADWAEVSVPHDWSIAQDFNAKSPATYEGGYLDGGDAWYRTTFTLDGQQARRHLLSFDGVAAESTVYLNGALVAQNHYAYNPFAVDVTEQVQRGVNVLAVFVRNAQPSSRWYSGSGLFRPATLLTFRDDQIRMENIRVLPPETEEAMAEGETTVTFQTINRTGEETECTFTANFYSPDGVQVATTSAVVLMDADAQQTLTLSAAVPNPVRWTVGDGQCYSVQITAHTGDCVNRSARLSYGYRTIRFDAETGFYLNGEALKLHGVCMHHDGGCIGAAENRSDIERRVALLQQMGCNAIRLCHNPFGAVYLDVCQQMGMLVVEEFFDGWTKGKNAYDFAQHFAQDYGDVIRSVVRREWNNPAVIMWSIGNEITTGITGSYTESELTALCQQLRHCVRQYDTTRPVTLGNDRPTGALAALLPLVDVVGINYSGNNQTYQADKPIFGSETTSALSSRGVYEEDEARMVYPSYDNRAVSWGSTAAETLNAYQDSARSCGHFVWTGFDYLGEPTEWNKYPAKSSYFGILDTCGFPKDIYYMYQSMWTDAPMMHILPHWTHETGDTVTVWLYSNCAEVELSLNGTSLGRKTRSERGSKNEYAYEVAYATGTLVANGYDAAGNLVAQDVQYTSGAPAALVLTANLADVGVATDDLCYITCDVVDNCGTLCPEAENAITFTVTGGQIIGTDNGHGANVEKMQGNSHAAFSGKCLCVVKHDGAAGELTVTATATGLRSGSVTIEKGAKTVAAAVPSKALVDAENPPLRDPDAVIPATGVSLSASQMVLMEGKSETLAFTVSPENCTQPDRWSVSPSGVVSVSGGALTALSVGTATVTVTVGDYSASCQVTVTPRDVVAESVTLSSNVLTLTEGETATLKATISPENTTDKTIVWQVTPSSVASVKNGVVTALSSGNAVITASCGKVSAVCTLTVTSGLSKVSSLTLSRTTMTLQVGQTSFLSTTILPAAAASREVNWQVTPSGVVSVENGLVTALSLGTATIMASCGGKTASCMVTVSTDVPVSSIRIAPSSLTIYDEATALLTATILPENATDQTVTWSAENVSDENTSSPIVTVDSNGLVTGKRYGIAKVTGTCGEKSASCLVTVETRVQSITVSPSALQLEAGTYAYVTATANYKSDAVLDTQPAFAWYSDSTAVADVEETEIPGRAIVFGISDGTAAIYASAKWTRGACAVQVGDSAETVASVTISDESKTLEVGQTFTLSAQAVTTDGSSPTIEWKMSSSGEENAISLSSTTGSSVTVTALCAGVVNVVAYVRGTSAETSCTVTVIDSSASEPGEEESSFSIPQLYALPKAVTFTAGTDGIIDTGLQLFADISTPPEYTILFDVDIGENAIPEGSGGSIVLAHCMEETSPWPGFVIQICGNTTQTLQANMYGSVYRMVGGAAGKSVRGAIVLNAAIWSGDVRVEGDDTDRSLTTATISAYNVNVDKTLLLGGYQTSDGTHGRYFDGTLNQFIVLDGALPTEEMQTWLDSAETEANE